MRVKVELKGDKEVAKALKKLADNAPLVRLEVLASALAIQKETKERLKDYGAIDTGNLRNSVLAETTADGFTGEIGPTAPYAPYIEFGTRWIAERPCLYPAYDNEVPKFLARIKALYEKIK